MGLAIRFRRMPYSQSRIVTHARTVLMKEVETQCWIA
jgi:hypothetical protein